MALFSKVKNLLDEIVYLYIFFWKLREDYENRFVTENG